MKIYHSLIPQLLIDVVILIGCMGYLPQALRTRKNRFVVVVFLCVGAAALVVNLKGYAIKGPVQGFSLDHV